MLSLLAATLLRFSFGPSLKASYDVTVNLDGYLPILGGRQGKVKVEMSVGVAGRPLDENGNAQVLAQVDRFKLSLDGSVLPFGSKSIQSFFPPNLVSLLPTGQIVRTDAKALSMPVRLPGLDSRQLPAISFLPICFPPEGVEVGKSYTFVRRFGSSDATYEVTPLSLSDGSCSFSLVIHQSETTYEDSSHNPLPTRDSASFEVLTNVEGKGMVEFDRVRGLVSSTKIDVVSKGSVLELKSGLKSERELGTYLGIRRT
jgi:hypothetical protein